MHIRTEIRPGDIGYLIYLHGVLYAREYGLDRTFEGYVAAGLAEFAKSYDEHRDRLWLAEEGGKIVGSIAIVGQTDGTAQLRWFLVDHEQRGGGLGRRLLRDALEFCRDSKFTSVFLWTLGGLNTAAHLYTSAGFRLTEQNKHEIWGGVRTEERYDLTLSGD
jgi:N-acetylglutamate synthase-like GNAT family acetyltransferase